MEISVVREFPRPRPSTSLCILGRSLCRRLSLLFLLAQGVTWKLMRPTNERGDRQKGGKKKKEKRKKRKEKSKSASDFWV